jgi:hypothetical protein
MPNQKAKVETDRDAKSLYEGSLGELLKVLTEEPSFRLTNCGQDLGDEGHKKIEEKNKTGSRWADRQTNGHQVQMEEWAERLQFESALSVMATELR